MPQAHAAGAASVVAQLRAFLSDPSPYRGELGATRACLECGHHIFKFAQGKFPPGLAHDLPTHEREELRQGAVAFIREVCFRAGATHYELLCVPPEAKREAIKDHYHLLMALIHPDRAEGGREAWPADWAQRANRAYAVLADDEARSGYDESLATFVPPPVPRRNPLRRRTRKAGSFKTRTVKVALVSGAIAATLLLLNAWVDIPEEHFHVPGTALGRDVARNSERPRFLGVGVVPARAPVDDTLLAPLWRERPLSATREAPPAPALPIAPPNVSPPVAPRTVTPPSADLVPSPIALAQAPAPRAASPAPAITSEQIEIVVARLVGYYEAGETDNIMSLLDPKEAANWQSARTRQAYADFFRATRERRLLVKSLEWQAASASARAQGQATVQAAYVDAPGGIERDVEVEMEIALRDGQAKITRLSLFPNAP